MLVAKILNKKVVHIQNINDSMKLDLYKLGFDELVNLEPLKEKPQVGWSYENKVFLPPKEELKK